MNQAFIGDRRAFMCLSRAAVERASFNSLTSRFDASYALTENAIVTDHFFVTLFVPVTARSLKDTEEK